MIEKQDAQRRIDGFDARLDQICSDAMPNHPCDSALTVILLGCLALHAVMLFLATAGESLGWTVFWLLALCLDIYSLGENWL
ncbi:hypothetical protein [Collinsella intestinalis]|uniref:hypothetical protein n=1 Tax=Collinsella intestinalis TaxID=147207 RepID=UPI0026719F10|nr:hypothetical protein [Collinsella intestinalis]